MTSEGASGGQGLGKLARPHPSLVRAFEHEWTRNADIYDSLIDYNCAHIVMLRERGVVPPQAAAAILRCLAELRREGFDSLPYDAARDGLQPNLEVELTRRLGAETGGWLNTGRARQECELVARQITSRNASLGLLGQLHEVLRALVDLSRRGREAVMPYHTWAQHAEPITFGYFAAAEAYGLAADMERIQAAFDRLNLSRADIGQVTPPPLPLDRERVASLLGFDGCITNSLYAYASLDTEIALIGALAVYCARMARFCETLFVWASPEFGFVAFGPEFTGTSYAMPQKRNPYALRLARPLAGRASGAWNNAIQLYAGSLAIVGNGLIHVPNVLLELISDVTDLSRLMADALPTLAIYRERMAAAATRSDLYAPQLVFHLVEAHGLSFRQAHEAVAQALVAEAKPSAEVLAQRASAVSGSTIEIDPGALDAVMDIRNIVSSRTIGGPAPGSVDRQIEELETLLERARSWHDARCARVAEASDELAKCAAPP